MNSKKKRIVRCAIFCFGFILILNALTYVMLEKQELQYAYNFKYQKNDSIDVIFLGPSSTIRSFIPMELWHNYGIASYNLATSNTEIPESYYAAELAVEKQHPKMIFLDLSYCFSKNEQISYPWLHYLTDGYNIDKFKYNAVTNLVQKKDYSEFYLPIIKFHSRWESLSEADFQNIPNKFLNGGLIDQYAFDIMPFNVTSDYLRSVIADSKYQKMPSNINKYLTKFIDLCNQNNITLVFTVLPGPWPLIYTDMENDNFGGIIKNIQDFASEKEVPFLNMFNYSDEIQLDYNVDYQSGPHPNYTGALKITDFIGKYIKENYKIPIHTEDPDYSSWNDNYNKYINHVSIEYDKYISSHIDFTKSVDLVSNKLSKVKVNLNEVYQTDSIILPNTSSNVQTIENNIALKPNSEYRLSFETDNTNNYVPELLYFDFYEAGYDNPAQDFLPNVTGDKNNYTYSINTGDSPGTGYFRIIFISNSDFILKNISLSRVDVELK